MNLGLRYDLVTGFNFDQSRNPNYILIRDAARAGRFNTLPAPVAEILNHFAEDPKNDTNSFQPRLGLVYDLRGDSKDVLRGGWGIYTDFGYNNANALFPAADASGQGLGNVFNVNNQAGIRNPDGSFFTVGQPLSNIQSQNQAVVVPGQYPLFGQWVDPLLQMPYQIQSNIGWSHELTPSTVVQADFVNSLGRDLNTRPRANQRILGTTIRRVSAVLPRPLSSDTNANRPAVSNGESTYTAMILAIRRRMSNGIDYTASYTLASAKSTIGTGVDQLNTANIQDPNDPFDAPVQNGPATDTDARHRFSVSATFQMPWGINFSPIYLYRSALPVALVDGRDLNLDGDATEIPLKAFAVDTFNTPIRVISGGRNSASDSSGFVSRSNRAPRRTGHPTSPKLRRASGDTEARKTNPSIHLS